MSLTATIVASISASQSKSADLGTASFPASLASRITLANGTAAGQADLVWTDTRTLAASASEDLDLAGSLADIYGATITAAKIKAIMVIADSGNTNDVVIGAAASNAFVGPLGSDTDTISLKPGYCFLLGGSGAGYPVTAGTGDILKIANSGDTTGVTYSIIVIATSA